MSEKTARFDLIGRQLRLQWAETLSEPMTDVLENLLQRLREAEAKQQMDEMVAPLAAIGDVELSAILCPSDVSEKCKEVVADLRSAIELKVKQNTH